MPTSSEYPGTEVLTDLYVERGFSIRQIGEHFSVSAGTASKWMKLSGIAMRTPAESRALAMGIPRPDREKLHRLYVEQQMTCEEVGEILGVTGACVHRWLGLVGISARSISEARYIAKKSVYSEETLERMRNRAASMRAKITDESRAKQSVAMKGRRAPNKGVPHSEEHKAKLRAAWERPGYREMKSQALRGDKSPNWKGGVKPEIAARLDRYEWRQIRQLVYARDNWTCQDCRCKCKNSADSKNDGKKKIQAHHVVARRKGGTDDLANLVTLCMSCHHKRERLGT